MDFDFDKANSETAITSFVGEHFFLSNMYPDKEEGDRETDKDFKIVYKGLTYPTVEHAFQAQKVLDDNDKLPFTINAETLLTPTQAKHRGKRVKLREDWEDVKVQIMEEIVRAKFSQNKNIANKLIDTGDAQLIEGNTWRDNTWGAYITKNGLSPNGKNYLGKILMKITRGELKESTKIK